MYTSHAAPLAEGSVAFSLSPRRCTNTSCPRNAPGHFASGARAAVNRALNQASDCRLSGRAGSRLLAAVRRHARGYSSSCRH
eukprot:310685-Pleurochrysis_carterae.AAC.4